MSDAAKRKRRRISRATAIALYLKGCTVLGPDRKELKNYFDIPKRGPFYFPEQEPYERER